MADLGAVGHQPLDDAFYGLERIKPARWYTEGKYPSTTISNVITDVNGDPAERTVLCFLRKNHRVGMLVDMTVSSPVDGSYTVKAVPGEQHLIIALDDDGGVVYNDKIAGQIIPT